MARREPPDPREDQQRSLWIPEDQEREPSRSHHESGKSGENLPDTEWIRREASASQCGSGESFLDPRVDQDQLEPGLLHQKRYCVIGHAGAVGCRQLRTPRRVCTQIHTEAWTAEMHKFSVAWVINALQGLTELLSLHTDT